VRILCNVANVSRSGFYLYLKEKDEKDYHLIKSAFNTKTGARTVKMKLDDKGITMNLKRVRRIMKKYDLICKIRRTNKSRVSLKKNIVNQEVANLLDRRFEQNIPHKVASTDITYLKNKGRFSFLSTVKDLATGEVLTWKLSKLMNLDLVLNTIDDLEVYFRENNLGLDNLLLHSDHGFQYTSLTYHNRLKELGVTQSMSRKGNSVDNAPIESFFGHMKDEIEYSKLNFTELEDLIDRYMVEYNYKRRQWGRKRLAPVYYRDYLLNNFAVNCV
jgi:transposase InsO family protein